MKRLFIFSLAIFVLVFISCEKKELIVTPLDEISQLNEENACEAGLFCIPPFGVDTSCIQIQMILDDIPYNPTANFSCMLPLFASLFTIKIWHSD